MTGHDDNLALSVGPRPAAIPNAPALAAFGGDRLHAFNLEGSWDLDRAASENTDALFHSIRRVLSKDTLAQWDDLTFQFGPRAGRAARCGLLGNLLNLKAAKDWFARRINLALELHDLLVQLGELRSAAIG